MPVVGVVVPESAGVGGGFSLFDASGSVVRLAAISVGVAVLSGGDAVPPRKRESSSSVEDGCRESSPTVFRESR